MTRVVNKRTHSYNIYIGRGSKWGNPFRIGVDGSRTEVIELYRQWLWKQPKLITALKAGELKGQRLGCFCKPYACHGDVLKSASEYYG